MRTPRMGSHCPITVHSALSSSPTMSPLYQNDRRKIVWARSTSRPMPQPKGDGQSIMVSDFLTSEWGACVMAMSVSLTVFLQFFTDFCFQGSSGYLQSWQEPRWLFQRGRSPSRRSTPPSIFLRACPKVTSGLSFFLTMHQAIKNELWMRYRHGKCRKVGTLPFFYFIFTHFHCHSTKRGWTHHRVGRACDAVSSQMVMSSPSTFQTIIPPCLGGSRDGADHPGARFMAGQGAQGAVSKFPLPP